GFAESIDVRVVNVEAVVTDRRGARVHGLKRDDLRLFVDGSEVPIDYFAEGDEGGGGSASAVAGAPTAPAAARGGPAPQGRSPPVFVDESSPVKAQRTLVLKRLGEQLSRLGPADRVAIVAFDGDRLAVLSGWTGDAAALAEVIARAKKRPAGGISIVA